MKLKSLAAATSVAALLIAAPAGAVQAPSRAGLPELDARSGDRAAVSADVSNARSRFASRAGVESIVDGDPVNGGLRALGRTDTLLSGPARGDAADIALAYVRAHLDVFGLSSSDLAGLDLAARYTSPDGVTHLTWRQTVDGIPAYDSELNANVAADGRIVNVSGSPVADLAAGTTPAITASEALAAGQRDVGASMTAPSASPGTGAERATTFANGDSARLVVLADPDGDRLGWRLTVAGDAPHVYDEVVDAGTGDVLVRHDLTSFAVDASVYDVHPGIAAAPHSVDLTADPNWLTSSTTLSGRNAHAYSDVSNPDVADPSEEVAPAGGNYSFALQSVAPAAGNFCPNGFPQPTACSWDGTTRSTASVNREQDTTQVFYFVNTFHDWLAQAPIGFDDASHNFEVGGLGGDDPVRAEAQDGGGYNNANMSTPFDGHAPRMQMYLFGRGVGWPAVDGGDDATVVYHEYTHGLSNRLVNNGLGGGLESAQSGAMGEGWSDWYAMDYLVAKGFVTDTPGDGEVVLGQYVTNDRVTGIRTKALDCAVGATAAGCAGTTTVPDAGGYTFGDMGSVFGASAGKGQFEVHADGEIWVETLWDLRKAVGAANARALITGGMRLSVANPSFLEMRDAILQESRVLGGGLTQAVWNAFAGRGMGYGARTGHGLSSTSASEAFDLPRLAEVATPGVSDVAGGDGDGIPEPGETLQITLPLGDPGEVPLSSAAATLTSTTPGVVVGTPNGDYGTIPAGGSRSAGYTVTLPTSQGCATPLELSLAVRSDQGTATLPVSIPLGSGTRTNTSATPFAVPDGTVSATYSPGATTSQALAVPSAGVAGPVSVRLQLTHPRVRDLHVTLTAPDGTSVKLLDNAGTYTAGLGTFDGLDVTLTDAAANGVQDISQSSGVPTGSFRPAQTLSRLAKVERQGTWTLSAFDDFGNSVGTITSWGITTSEPACSTTASPPASASTPATDVGTSSATLTGRVDPKGQATSYRFEYGTAAGYGSTTDVGDAGAGSGSVDVKASVSGLTAATSYHYRLVTLRGTPPVPVAVGDDATFTTGSGQSGGTGATPTGTTPAVQTPAGVTAGAQAPKPPASAPKAAVGALKLTLDRKRKLSFSATVVNATGKGSVKLVVPAKTKKGKPTTIGTLSFTIGAKGKVAVSRKLSASLTKKLRKLAKAKVAASFAFAGGRTATGTASLSVKR